MSRKDYSPTPENIAKQRLKDYVQDDEWIKDFLERSHICHIATHWDEQPFVTPSNFCYREKSHEIIFHSNIVGRIRANSERHPEVSFEVSAYGKLLPSNIALEFSLQYESVMGFGKIKIVEDILEKRDALNCLLQKYFPHMESGKEYRPITDVELKQTSVYSISIESWSGKRNWEEQAEQSDEWKALPKELLE